MSPVGIVTVKTRDNAEWLSALRSSGAEQATALADLRVFLLRAALYALRRARGNLGLMARAEIEALAEAVGFDDVPLDELARHWGSNRNALYKLLHDARRKLKACLEVRFSMPVQPTRRSEP